jgi:hypothetical protein
MLVEILNSFEMNVAYGRRLCADITKDQFNAQPVAGMNTPAWIVGHLCGSFQLIGGELGLKPWLPAGWATLYGRGTRPSPTPTTGPGKAQLLSAFEDAAKRLVAALKARTNADLAQPLPDERFRKYFPTLGSAVLHILTVHAAGHLGQLSAWRRAMGLPSVNDPE